MRSAQSTRKVMSWLPVLALATAAMATGCSASLSTSVRKDVKTSMADRHDAIAHCYERALERDRSAEGDVTLAFKVTDDSRNVQSVEIADSTVGDAEFENCVLAQARKAKLRKEPDLDEVSVVYPMSFRQRK